MAHFQIIVSQQDYKILDADTQRLIVEGIATYSRALMLFERLISLQENKDAGILQDLPGA
ncbi:MAG: hypothetical protein H7839_05520 [Magnetococcus sp. YQC-5]